MPSVTKLAIIAARNLEGKLSARPKGTGTSEIPVTLYDIKLGKYVFSLERTRWICKILSGNSKPN
jgi:hypothetical protein